MNTRQTPEYIFKENPFCVYYKLFGSGAATHLVAILCGTTDGEDVAGDYSILVDGEDIRHSSENICSLYRDQIASFFGSNHHILGVDVTDMFDVRNGQLITNRSQLTFEVQHDGSVIGTFQGAAFQNSEGYPLPEMHNIFRVAGQISKQAFLFGGASWYLKLLQVALKTGAPIDKDKDVLDWGCGCGRITRHFFAADHKRITGIDIDPVNIEWANSHLGEKFEVVDTSPPTSLRDGEYHVIYGHSVFTHLTESSQFEWLAEISRLLSSGGRAYVTINSDRGVDISKSRPGKSAKNLAEMVLDRGIVDFGPLSVGVDAKEPGYYRMTAHSHEYVRQNWSKYLNVLGFVEFFADHQDLVVLEKT